MGRGDAQVPKETPTSPVVSLGLRAFQHLCPKGPAPLSSDAARAWSGQKGLSRECSPGLRRCWVGASNWAACSAQRGGAWGSGSGLGAGCPAGDSVKKVGGACSDDHSGGSSRPSLGTLVPERAAGKAASPPKGPPLASPELPGGSLRCTRGGANPIPLPSFPEVLQTLSRQG